MYPSVAGAAIGAATGLLGGWLLTVPVFSVLPDANSGDTAEWRPPTCGRCGRPVSLADVVPIAGWTRRGRTCRGCGTTRYRGWAAPAALASVAAGITGWSVGPRGTLAPFLVMAIVGTVAACIDLRTRLIPRRVAWGGLAAAVATTVLCAALLGVPSSLGRAALGAAAYFGLLATLSLIHPRGMGFGDVRLSALLGWCLGWVDLRLVLAAAMLGSVLGVLSGVLALARRDGDRAFPYGPALVVGALLALWLRTPLLTRWLA